MLNENNIIVAVVGLGYVGLPLAVEFGKFYRTIGFDKSKARVQACQISPDSLDEIEVKTLNKAKYLTFTNDAKTLIQADFHIIAVPTPVDDSKVPNLEPLISATTTVARYMKRGCIIVFESTVYPGTTEEVCVPILEKISKMKWKKDFHVGYSPERINPGDKHHSLTNIIKVVSADEPKTLTKLSRLYSSIISAGIFEASSIEVAEAAKVIENTQRDLNIALMNELAIVFDKMNIDTKQVLRAASTKWNFLSFKPGLVGGHCIGVDPYYLTYKSEKLGYEPEVILAGRKINDGMSKFIAEKTIKLMIKKGTLIQGSRVGVLGLTFKEDCADIRNSKVPDIVRELEAYGIQVSVHDPLANRLEAKISYGLDLEEWEDLPVCSALVFCVEHKFYRDLEIINIKEKLEERGVIIDVKSQFDWNEIDPEILYWNL